MYEAAQTLAKWDRQYGKVMPIGVSVNLSTIQMARDDVPSVVEEARRYSGVSGRRLTVELTDSELIADPDKARHVLAAIKGLEAAYEMDVVGNGCSTMARFQHLPINLMN